MPQGKGIVSPGGCGNGVKCPTNPRGAGRHRRAGGTGNSWEGPTLPDDDLRTRLLEFDGVAVSILSEAQAVWRDREGFLDALVDLSFDPSGHLSDGATWILKAELEDGTELTPDRTEKLVSSLDSLTSWQSVLHICQMIERVSLSEPQAGRVIRWAQTHTGHKRPFVRAWSLHAIVVLGRAFPNYRQDAEAALAKGEADKAASVRARARRLRQ